jgi:hypothetical protein
VRAVRVLLSLLGSLALGSGLLLFGMHSGCWGSNFQGAGIWGIVLGVSGWALLLCGGDA